MPIPVLITLAIIAGIILLAGAFVMGFLIWLGREEAENQRARAEEVGQPALPIFQPTPGTPTADGAAAKPPAGLPKDVEAGVLLLPPRQP
jgi:hypothetical protein